MPRTRLTRSGAVVPLDQPRHRDPERRWRSTFAWQVLRSEQIKRQSWCNRCGARSRLTADHIVPVSAGGAWDDPSNLQTLCLRCNSAKGSR